MAVRIYRASNLAATTLASAIGSADTSLTVATGEGSSFPTLSTGEVFVIRVEGDGNVEWMVVTARSGDTFTVERAVTPYNFSAGAAIENRIESLALNNMRQKGDTREVTADPNGSSPNYDYEQVLNTTTNEFWQHVTGTTWVVTGLRGSATVTISGEDGTGQWRVVGESTWNDSGDVAVPLTPGLTEIEFSDVGGYTKPSNIYLTVVAYQTVSGTGVYT